MLNDIIYINAHSFCDHLEVMFGEGVPSAPWDTEHKYQLLDLRVFFEDREKEKLCSVDPTWTLSQVLSDPRYIFILSLIYDFLFNCKIYFSKPI